jgi:hypothetical protein
MADGTEPTLWTYTPADQPFVYHLHHGDQQAGEAAWLHPVQHPTVAMQRIVDSLNRPPWLAAPSTNPVWNASTRRGRICWWEFTHDDHQAAHLAVDFDRQMSAVVTLPAVQRILDALNPGGGLPPVVPAATVSA